MRSASCGSAISSTFSAFVSPERERLNEPRKGGVVGDRDLGVHEVVDRLRRVRDRALAVEDLERAVQQRRLPLRARVVRPLVEDLVDLGRVADAGDVEPALRESPTAPGRRTS
jgi:hypothetical protein